MLLTLVLVLLAPAAFAAQFTTNLSAETDAAFDKYVRTVEQTQDAQTIWSDPGLQQQNRTPGARGRDIVVKPVGNQSPVSIPGGLIHDWVGGAVIEQTTITAVSAALADFDRHQQWYPEVVQSKVLFSDSDSVSGEWIVRRQNVITVVLRVRLKTKVATVSPVERRLISKSERIAEIQDFGEPRQREFPPNEGHGVLWRLNAYWRLRQTGEDVLAECRTITLSRSIPVGLSWIVSPLVRSIPRDTLQSTLENTRKAVERKESQ